MKRDAITVLRAATRELPNEIYVEAFEAVEALDALVRAVHAFPSDPEAVRDWHPNWRGKMSALIEAGNRLQGGAE